MSNASTTIRTTTDQRWARYKLTEEAEMKLSKAMRDSENEKDTRKGKTTQGVMSVVDDFLTAVAGAAGPYGVVIQVYLILRKRAKEMKEVPEKATRMLEQADFLMQYYDNSFGIRFANDLSAYEYTDKRALQLLTSCHALLDGFRKNNERRHGFRHSVREAFRGLASSSVNMSDIDDCIQQLKDFQQELMFADRGMSNTQVLPHLEGETVGLEERYHLTQVLQFLKSSSSEGKICVLYLHGARGVGKSRFLNELVSRCSEYMQENLKTYILDCRQSGDRAGQTLWPLQWQLKLVEQMLGTFAAAGLASEAVCKQKLVDAARHWKVKKRKVLLAIDNLPEDGNVGDLLPEFTSCLPEGSCVIVSAQGGQDTKSLAVWHKDLHRVFPDSSGCHCVHKSHKVEKLQLYQARKLFCQYSTGPKGANIDETTRKNTADNLILRCDGLPLLLKYFGDYLGNSNLSVRGWEEVCRELANCEDKAKQKWRETLEKVEKMEMVEKNKIQDEEKKIQDEAELRVILKLRLLCRKRIPDDLQLVVGDIAFVFNGWTRGTIQNIFGQETLKRLENEGILVLKELNARQQLTRSVEVARNIGAGPWKMSVTSIAPEMLKSVQFMPHEHHVQAVASPAMPKFLQHLYKKRPCRSLCLIDIGCKEELESEDSECKDEFEMPWLEKLEGLHYMVLHNVRIAGTSMAPLSDLRYLHLGSDLHRRDNSPSPRLSTFPFRAEHLIKVQTLVLHGLDFGGFGIQIPPLLVNLSLIDCTSLRRAFPAIFGSKTLQTLHIRACEEVHKIDSPVPNTSVRSLSLQSCLGLDLEDLPIIAAKLEALTKLVILSCTSKSDTADNRRKTYQSGTVHGSSTKKRPLRQLIINDSHEMLSLPKDVLSYERIKELNLEFCSKIETLPHHTSGFQEMEHLNLAWCISLMSLPPDIGRLGALRTLSVVACSKLGSLPKEIGNLRRLETLKMDYCASLATLPEDIANLESLSHLSMSWCTMLRDDGGRLNLSKLPNKLKYLNVAGLDPTLLQHFINDLSKADRKPANLIKDTTSDYRRFCLDFLSEQTQGTVHSSEYFDRQFKSGD